jgi:putative heme-binding domain-containing protein
VKPDEAGYTAAATTLVDGAADRWFRPSDICVAPDGSLIVADWHDPGVGGHGMSDTEKGRLYRIAPKGVRDRAAAPDKKVSSQAVDVGSIAGAVEALSSPNLCTRAMALERLSKEPVVSAAELAEAFERQTDLRLRARLAWAAGMLPGQAEEWIDRLARHDDEHLRIMALRMCRLTKGDVIGLVEKLSADPSAAVRRDASIALRGVAGERADQAWAALAAQHKAGDRWELEALGISADGSHGMAGPNQWDGRLAAWLAKVNGQWKSPSGREIIWRSRATATPQMLCELIGDGSTSTSESLALVRALDFQETTRAADAIGQFVSQFTASEEKLRAILPELVARLDPGRVVGDGVGTRVDEAAGYAAGTRAFIEIVQRFGLEKRWPEVVALAAAESTSDQLATEAVGVVLDAGRQDAVLALVTAGGPKAARLLEAIGINGSTKSLAILESLVTATNESPAIKTAAIRGLARSNLGAKQVVAMAKAGELEGVLPQVAAVAIASCPWIEVKQAAAGVLPMPKSKGGEKLPPVSELLKRSDGNAERGRTVFAGSGTCVKCHVVGSEGKSVGPNLSEIGGKLSRQAMYEAILAPSAAISHNYETFTALLDDGRSVTGLLVSQSPSDVVIKGPDGIDVTVDADAVEELVKQPISLMPADLAATLSVDELVDLVAWLETLKTTNEPREAP